METLTLTFADEQAYQELLRLARAAGLHISNDGLVSKPIKPKRSREELLAIIRRGGDGLSIPDPLAWQREQRDDRDLPFHILGQQTGE